MPNHCCGIVTVECDSVMAMVRHYSHLPSNIAFAFLSSAI